MGSVSIVCNETTKTIEMALSYSRTDCVCVCVCQCGHVWVELDIVFA